MKICTRKINCWVAGVFSLVFFMNIPVNAALYEMDENTWTEGGELNKYPSFFDMIQSPEAVKNNYQSVLELLKQKKIKEAQTKVAQYIQQTPTPFYYNLKAIVEISSQDLSSAEQSFKKAISLGGGNAQAYTGLSKLAFERKDLLKAKEFANKAVEKNINAINAYGLLANIALQQEGADSAEKVLLDANTKVKGNLRAELEMLKLLKKFYKEKKQPEKLLVLAKALAERSNGEKSVLSFLADAELTNQDFSDAEKTLRQIISQHPNEAKHHFLLARVLAEQAGKEDQVIELLDQATSNLKFSAYILAYKTTFLIKKKQYKQAFAVAKKIEKTYPKLKVGEILKGDIFVAEKKYNQAMQVYQHVYQTRPSINVLDAMLKTLAAQKKYKEGVKLLEAELEKNKGDAEIQLRLAELNQSMGDYDMAAKYYQELLATKHDNPILLNNLAWVYSQQKNPKALKLAETAYKKAPKSGVIADTYGYILFKNGRNKEALEILSHAIALTPGSALIKRHLAEVYIDSQNNSKAKELLTQIIEQGGDQKNEAIRLIEKM